MWDDDSIKVLSRYLSSVRVAGPCGASLFRI